MAETKSGWIWKEGNTFKSWKKRYLVINTGAGVMNYFEDEKQKKKKGDIKISAIVGIRRIRKYDGKAFVFAVSTTTGNRTFFIQGTDEDNVSSWITAIEAVSKVKCDAEIDENGKGIKKSNTDKSKEKAKDGAKAVGKAVVKTLAKLEYKGFKSVEMPEIDAWFDAINEVMETIIHTGEACDEANEGVLLLCEAQEMIDAGVQDKTVQGVLNYFVKTTKSKGARLCVESNDNGTFTLTLDPPGEGAGWKIFEGILKLINALQTFIVETPTLIPKIQDAVEQSKDIPDKIQNGVMGMNPLKAGKAIKSGAENCKSLAAIPNALKNVIESVITLLKTFKSILTQEPQ